MQKFKHNLSSYRLLTGDLGKLYPCGLVEVLPGDIFQHSTSILARLSPLVAPVMHQSTLRVHHFFVPHRLSWDDTSVSWEDFITAGPLGTNSDTVPTLNSTGTAFDLLDYLGLPLVASVPVSSMPVRAFNLIFNEYYRDQDLVTERTLEDLTIPNISWEKDYFTTARTSTQKGTDVSLPLGTRAQVHHDVVAGTDIGVYSDQLSAYHKMAASTANLSATNNASSLANALYVDLANATAATVNTIRRAFALQRFAEDRLRYGSRYVEYLAHDWGVRSADARLQRPEYLGGGRVNVSISEVLQTAPETIVAGTEYGVGDLYGHGIAAMRSNRYRKHFDEHGYVLSLLSIRPRAMYTNGIPRTWLRQDREDFYTPQLAEIGQQEVWKGEVYAASSTHHDTFGYQDRYSEYREQPSMVTAEFRELLDYWHLGRDFASAPSLNASFVECNPSKRIFQEQTNHSAWMMAQHSLMAARVVKRKADGRIL